MSRLAVFAYGSLVSAASAGQTLGRPVESPLAARLADWRRAWTLCRDNHRSEKTFARSDGSLPRFCLGLNLERAEGAPAPNGALIELTDSELERLDLREMRYRRVEVTELVETPAGHGFDRIFSYEARPENHVARPAADTVVIANYLATVEAAFAALGPGELDLFHATSGDPGVEIAEATLVRDEIPPGNPRGW